jgi:hypothetical protein
MRDRACERARTYQEFRIDCGATNRGRRGLSGTIRSADEQTSLSNFLSDPSFHGVENAARRLFARIGIDEFVDKRG